MFLHYIGQYFACLITEVPVTQWETHVYKVYLEYAASYFAQIFMITAAGPLFNTFMFVLLYVTAFTIKSTCDCFPRVWYKIIAIMGVFTVLDPIIVLVVDIASGSYAHGDWFKFYNFYLNQNKLNPDANGYVGIYITFFLMFGLTVFNGFLFYYYMIFVHMNGRILDLYKRLSGTSKTFFIPHDAEVSLKYLQWVV